MNEHKTADGFIDCFIAFITGRERDVVKRFRMMTFIESMLKQDPIPLAKLFYGKMAKSAFAEFGKDAAVENVSIWLRTEIAKEMLDLHEIGLLRTKKKGDLRGARLISDEREQLLAIMKLKMGREHPGKNTLLMQESAKLDCKFHERLARVLKKPPLEFKDLNRSKLVTFLLIAWVNEIENRKGQLSIPLCHCSDPVIAKLAEFLGIQKNVTATQVKKTWERLGLRKSRRITFWSLSKRPSSRSDGRFQTIVFSDLRRRN